MAERQDIPSEAVAVLRVVQDVLGPSLLGAYLFGSAVVDGLKVASDVDVLVLVDCSLTSRTRSRVVQSLMQVSGRIGNAEGKRPIELTIISHSDVFPWRYPPKSQLVYGEWLREAFEKRQIPSPGADPDLVIVLTKVRDNSLPLIGPPASAILEPVPMSDVHSAMRDTLPALIAGLQGDERNVLLTLARMWLTAAEGRIAPKDVAAEWAIGQLTDSHDALLLEHAKRDYLGEGEVDSLGTHGELEKLVAKMRQAIEACLAIQS